MAYPNHPSSQQYRAYANAAMTVGKVRQVVMLYDGAIRFVKQATEAIAAGDFETRYNQLVKTSEIITGLQNSLDFEQGGDISKLLYDYYASIDARLFTVHRSNDVKMCEAIVKELKMMRDAWDQIDRDHARQSSESAAIATRMTPAMGDATAASASNLGVSA